MKMWEIRDDEATRFGRLGRGTHESTRYHKDDSYEGGYEYGYEDGYRAAMKEAKDYYEERMSR